MAKKRSPINLEKLKRESSSQLSAMLAELTGGPVRKPAQRKRRFIASGKFQMM